jgi:hypothetical protein
LGGRLRKQQGSPIWRGRRTRYVHDDSIRYVRDDSIRYVRDDYVHDDHVYDARVSGIGRPDSLHRCAGGNPALVCAREEIPSAMRFKLGKT